MAEAFLTFREHITFIMFAYYAADRIAPNHVAIPFMNGMLVFNRRRTLLLGDTKRQGCRFIRSAKGGQSILDASEAGMHYERPLYEMLVGNDWFCATYMHAKDIVNPQRMAGAERHEAVVAERNLTFYPYIYEQTRIPERESIKTLIDSKTAEQVILAQDEMLPRKDPFDDRYYLSGKMTASDIAITQKWMANRHNPLL